MPNLGLNLGLGVGGGALLPASPSEILQDLQFGVESDGLTLKDNKAGANVDEPELRDASTLSFNGTSTEIVCNQLSPTIPFSVCCRFRADNLGTSDGIIVQHDGAGAAANIDWMLYRGGSATYRMYISNGSASEFATTGALSGNDGLWHECVGVVTADDVIIYHNGTKFSTTRTITPQLQGDSDLRVGNFASNFAQMATSGCKIFDREVTQVEATNSTWLDATDAIWSLNTAETDGITAYDNTANENHGTIANGTWATDDGAINWNHSRGFSLYDLITLLLATIPPLDLIPILTQVPV